MYMYGPLDPFAWSRPFRLPRRPLCILAQALGSLRSLARALPYGTEGLRGVAQGVGLVPVAHQMAHETFGETSSRDGSFFPFPLIYYFVLYRFGCFSSWLWCCPVWFQQPFIILGSIFLVFCEIFWIEALFVGEFWLNARVLILEATWNVGKGVGGRVTERLKMIILFNNSWFSALFL